MLRIIGLENQKQIQTGDNTFGTNWILIVFKLFFCRQLIQISQIFDNRSNIISIFLIHNPKIEIKSLLKAHPILETPQRNQRTFLSALRGPKQTVLAPRGLNGSSRRPTQPRPVEPADTEAAICGKKRKKTFLFSWLFQTVNFTCQ